MDHRWIIMLDKVQFISCWFRWYSGAVVSTVCVCVSFSLIYTTIFQQISSQGNLRPYRITKSANAPKILTVEKNKSYFNRRNLQQKQTWNEQLIAWVENREKVTFSAVWIYFRTSVILVVYVENWGSLLKTLTATFAKFMQVNTNCCLGLVIKENPLDLEDS